MLLAILMTNECLSITEKVLTKHGRCMISAPRPTLGGSSLELTWRTGRTSPTWTAMTSPPRLAMSPISPRITSPSTPPLQQQQQKQQQTSLSTTTISPGTEMSSWWRRTRGCVGRCSSKRGGTSRRSSSRRCRSLLVSSATMYGVKRLNFWTPHRCGYANMVTQKH